MIMNKHHFRSIIDGPSELALFKHYEDVMIISFIKHLMYANYDVILCRLIRDNMAITTINDTSENLLHVHELIEDTDFFCTKTITLMYINIYFFAEIPITVRMDKNCNSRNDVLVLQQFMRILEQQYSFDFLK